MERTMKPWKNGRNHQIRDRPPQEVRTARPRNIEEHDLHTTFLQSLEIPPRKRNPQRDAIKPPMSRAPGSGEIGDLQVHRPKPSSSPSSRTTSCVRQARPASGSCIASTSTSNPQLLFASPSQPHTPVHLHLDATDSQEPAVIAPTDEEPPPTYEMTEWTAFIDRIQREGSSATYEDLLLLEEVNSPAQARSKRPDQPLDASIGTIELLSRRTTKDGKSKLKLGLAGTRVDSCGICLSQFREGQRGALTDCRHAFHDICLQRWVTQAVSCPICRVVLAPD